MLTPKITTPEFFRLMVNTAYTFFCQNGRKPLAADLHERLRDNYTEVEPLSNSSKLAVNRSAFGGLKPFTNQLVPALPKELQRDEDAFEKHLEKKREEADILKFKLIEQIMLSEEWVTAVRERGIPWEEFDGLTSEMHYAIALICDPTDRRSLERKLKDLGLSYNQYRAWLRVPAFNEAVTTLSEQMLVDSIGTVHTALVGAANKGDINAIKFFYEVTGRYDPNKKQVMDIMVVLAQIVEIIQRHVTNPEQLSAISTDLKMLAAVAVPSPGLTGGMQQ